MRKLILRYLTTFAIDLFLLTTVAAQDFSKTQSDSLAQSKLAESYYTHAENNFGELPNGEIINLFHKADSIFRTIGAWENSIVSIGWLCYLYQFERGYEEIDRLSTEALYLTRTHLKKDNPRYGRVLNLRGGIIYTNKKDILNSNNLYKEAIEVDKMNQISLLNIGTTYFNIGFSYLEAGDYDLAIDQFQNTLRINLDSLQSEERNERVIPGTYNQLGICYSKKKSFEEAIHHYEQGLKYAKEIQPSVRDIDQIIFYLYQNLADLYLETNQDHLAQKYISLAIDFQKGQAFIKDAYTYQLQGQLFLKEKKYVKALEAFQKSTRSAQLEYKDFEKHPEIGITYLYTGNAKLAQNEFNAALEHYQLALLNNSSGFDTKDTNENPPIDKLINPFNAIDIFEGKAKAFATRFESNGDIHNLEYAFDNYASAIQAISTARQSFNAEGSKHTLAEKVIPVYEGAIKTALKLHEITNKETWLIKAFQFAEGNKAAALSDAIQSNEALNIGNIPDSLLRMEYDLNLDIAFYEKLIYEEGHKKITSDSTLIKVWKNKLFERKDTYQNLIEHFETAYPEYYALKFKQVEVELADIQSKLNNTALVEFFVGTNQLFVFTITKENIYCIKTAKGAGFEKDIQNLRTLISTAPNSQSITKSLNEFLALSNRLYKKLLEQSLIQLTPSITHLILIPDDLLAYLPFSVLLQQENKSEYASFKNLPYLVNRFGLSYNYSVALWLKHVDTKPQPELKKFIGFAPEFTAYDTSNPLSPLSCNTTEVQGIGKLLSVEDSQYGAEATLEDFNNTAGDYQIIHLATHTTLDNENSAFNRIYFSDQYLSQNDLYHLKLNASLAVLSACNTGSGALKKGEGVMSLSRGFIHAGCPSILMSLWAVDDCTTADMMLYYYQALNDGYPKEVALQKAKSRYLDQISDILQSHPYYWAPFVQYGNTTPVELNTFDFNYLAIGGLAFLALLLFTGWKKWIA